MKLNHLCFADDILLFCRGEVNSAYLLLQGLKIFSETSGLQENKFKSTILCTGMPEEEKARLLQFFRFKSESFHFKYLEVPISHNKIKAT